ATAVLAFAVGLPVGPVFVIGIFAEEAAMEFANLASVIAVQELAPPQQVQQAVQWDAARVAAANVGGRSLGSALARLWIWAPFIGNIASYAQFLAMVLRWYDKLPSGRQKKPHPVRAALLRLRGLRNDWPRVVRHNPPDKPEHIPADQQEKPQQDKPRTVLEAL